MSAKIFLIEQDGIEFYFAATGEQSAIAFGFYNDFLTDLEEYKISELPESDWDQHNVHDQETGEPIKSFREWMKDEVKELPECIASTMEW